jgi:hypothetical protein
MYHIKFVQWKFFHAMDDDVIERQAQNDHNAFAAVFQREQDDADQSNDSDSTTSTDGEHMVLGSTQPSPDRVGSHGLRPRPITGMQRRPTWISSDQGDTSGESVVGLEKGTHHQTPMRDQTNRQRASQKQGNEFRHRQADFSAFEASTAMSNDSELEEVLAKYRDMRRIAQNIALKTETDAEQAEKNAGVQQRPSFDNTMGLLALVEVKLGDHNVYKHFLDVLKDFQSQRSA